MSDFYDGIDMVREVINAERAKRGLEPTTREQRDRDREQHQHALAQIRGGKRLTDKEREANRARIIAWNKNHREDA